MTETTPDVLVVYASTHGHTAKIAARIVATLRSQGIQSDLRDVAHAGDADPRRYQAVVVGASLHKEHHQKAVADWVAARRDLLEQRPSVFFSVSLSAADDDEASRAAAQRCIDDFCTQTGWTPGRTERIAGCLQYREYDAFTRQLMRLLMRRMGRPTDSSQDYDYTDWDAVDRLAREIGALSSAAACA
ncbi:MAG: menaquinone-dependent protoporphyrinogen oxidase [Solirubrobacteraceae bacterium]|nr:menaquinone-dependent protoporphyrinogen oxidase [Solirubrobacteraceae bacterium]